MIKKESQLLFETLRQYAKPTAVVIFAMLMMVQERNNTKFLPDLGFAWNGFVYYGVCCFLFSWIVLRIPVKNSFLGPGDFRFWIPIVIAFSVVALCCAVVGAQMQSFQNYYNESNFNLGNYLFTILVFMLGWEYLFRGFMLAGLKDSMKEGAILVQTIPFVLLHLDKPLAEIFLCIPAGLFWGYVCYRSGSFWPAFFMHSIMNILLKLFTIGYFS